jgi:nicotinamidase-related amidase
MLFAAAVIQDRHANREHDMTNNPHPKTLLQFAGADPKPAGLDDSVLVIVDAQNEYRYGKLPLEGFDTAVGENLKLLKAARAAGTPVIHVVHHSAPGRALFDPTSHAAEIVDELAPAPGETVVTKTLPNCFAGTSLREILAGITAKDGRRALLLTGFATHMCISATARAALDLGIAVTVVASATATRDLPNPLGGVIPAKVVQATALAELADRFAVVVADVDAICLAGVAA